MRKEQIAFLLALFACTAASANVPRTFSVQGVLRDNQGRLQSAMVAVTVQFFDAQTNGNSLGGPYTQSVLAQNGLFDIDVVDMSLPNMIESAGAVWLQLTVAGVSYPRQQVTAQLYALDAVQADGLSSACSGCVSDAMLGSSISATKINGTVSSATTAGALNGSPVGVLTTATNGEVLTYNGTQWIPATPAGGTVTGVTASSPLASSGGAAPNISLTGIVPIADGGTGSATKNFVDLTSDQTVSGNKSFSFNVLAPAFVDSANTGYFCQFSQTCRINILTVSGSVGLSGGNIDFGSIGVAPPSPSSAGWKIKTWSNGTPLYGIGVDSFTQWYSANTTHRWYITDGTNWLSNMSLDNFGTLRARGSVIANTTPDLAETIAADSFVERGDVVCADPNHRERARRCRRDDAAVLGVISDGSSGFLINAYGHASDAGLTGAPLVLAGRVPVKVSLENGPILIGDALTPSSTPGVAMRATDPGPSVGIALEPFDGGRGKTGKALTFIKVGEAKVASELMRLRDENSQLKERMARLERAVSTILAERETRPARFAVKR